MSQVDKERLTEATFYSKLPVVEYAETGRKSKPRARELHPAAGLLYELWYPEGRLVPDQTQVQPVEVPTFGSKLPHPERLPNGDLGWNMEFYLSQSIPVNPECQSLRQPLVGLLNYMAGVYDTADRKLHPDDYASETDFAINRPHFAEIRGSNAIAKGIDAIYAGIGDELKLLGENQVHNDFLPAAKGKLRINQRLAAAVSGQFAAQAEKTLRNQGIDLDINFISLADNHDIRFIRDGWRQSRNLHPTFINNDGQPVFVGVNYELTKISESTEKYTGWRLIEKRTKGGIGLLAIQAGTFTIEGTFDPETGDGLTEDHITFSVGITARPHTWSVETTIEDRRGGPLVSEPDKFLRLYLGQKSLTDATLVARQPEIAWYLNLYGRHRISLFENPQIFADPPRVIDILTRGVKQWAGNIGLYALRRQFAAAASSNISPEIWTSIQVKTWREEKILNLLGAAHLSPLLLASQLVPDSRYDSLPADLKLKLARHGIDYSLSLGQLWDIFSGVSDRQIEIYLRHVPTQDEYLANCKQTPMRYEDHGLFIIMRALTAAGVKFPEFSGNTLVQALYLFRHPQDNETAALASLGELDKYLNRYGRFIKGLS